MGFKYSDLVELKENAKINQQAIELGEYEHYKGNTYYVITEAQHTETNEWVVVYKDAYGKVWVRPSEMFKGRVQLETGEMVNRFRRV